MNLTDEEIDQLTRENFEETKLSEDDVADIMHQLRLEAKREDASSSLGTMVRKQSLSHKK